MTVLLISTIVSAVGNVLLGIYAMRFNPKSPVNRSFAFLAFAIAVWVVFFYWSLVDYHIVLVRVCMLLAAVWTYALFLFSYLFTYGSIPKQLIRFVSIFAVLIGIISLTPLVFSHSILVDGLPFPVAGQGMPLFFLYSVGLIIASAVLLVRNLWSDDLYRQGQAPFICLGLAFTTILITITNFIFVLILKTRDFLPLGLVSTLFFVGMTAYAMTRYKFLNVRLVFRKSIIYGGILIALSALYVFIVLALYAVIEQYVQLHPLVWLTASLLCFLVLFEYSKVRVKHALDGIFFVEEVRFNKFLHESKMVLNASHELETFVFELVASVQKVILAPVQAVLVRQDHMNQFKSFFPQQSRWYVHFEDELAAEFEKVRGIFLYEEMKRKPKAQLIVKLMKKKDAYIYMTIADAEKKLLIVVLIGEHKNKKIFTKKDLTCLKSFQDLGAQKIPDLLYWQRTMESTMFMLKQR